MDAIEQSVDITEKGLAAQVHSRVLAGHYAEQLEALQEAASKLGYYFAEAETSVPMPEVLAAALAEAIVWRKELSNAPKDPERARRWAEQAIEIGFGDVLRDAIIEALAELGIRLQATSDAQALVEEAGWMDTVTNFLDTWNEGSMRSQNEPVIEPFDGGERISEQPWTPQLVTSDATRDASGAARQPMRTAMLTVNVTKEEAIIAGDGLLATYNWKPDSWGNSVKRLSIRVTPTRTGDVEHDKYSVVAGQSDDAHHKGTVLAELGTNEEAIALIKRIEQGVKASLGIDETTTHVVEIPGLETDDLASGTVSVSKRSSGKIANAVNLVGGIVLAIAVLCTLVFAVPVAYKVGQDFASHVVSTPPISHEAVAGVYPNAMPMQPPQALELQRAVESPRPLPLLRRQAATESEN